MSKEVDPAANKWQRYETADTNLTCSVASNKTKMKKVTKKEI